MFYRLNRSILSALLFSTAALGIMSIHAADTPARLTLSQLEKRLAEIDSQLQSLPRYTPRGGFGHVGYRSAAYDDPDHTTSLQIDFAEETPVDQVVLVPTIIRDPAKGFLPDAFPRALRILDGDGTLLAQRNYSDQHLQSIAPFIIRLAGEPLSSLVVEATCLSPRAFDGLHVFQLAEQLAFHGQENVALGRSVTASTLPPSPVAAWAPEFVTDGSLPYLMNSAQGSPSVAYFSPRVSASALPLVLSIDLEESYPLTQLHLHTVDQSDTIPQSAPDGIGMPRHLLVEGGNQPDFSDARPLLETRCKSEFEAAPIMMWPLSGEPFRYVRLTALDPYLYPFSDGLHPRIGFAEIELFSNGRNVTTEKPFTVPGELRLRKRPASALTDGRNIFGRILPIRQWLESLALRYDLETERPFVAAELSKRYARQKENLRRMIWLATLLASGIGFTILVDRMLQMRKMALLKERFAADLHDELGANLHTIGLLSQLARKKLEISPEDSSLFLQRIEAATQRSSIAVRNVTKLQSANRLYSNLKDDMQQAAERILVNIAHELIIEGEGEGEALLPRLRPRTQIDLFLFYKECLINISRHSCATKACTRLQTDHGTVTLSVADNGRGLPESVIPGSLKRRAKLLRATLAVTTPADGGSSITMQFRPRRHRLRHRERS